MSEAIPVKLVAVGDGAVGKTTLLLRYTENKFPEQYVPTVFENYYMDIDMGDCTVNLGLWDTAGQEDFDRLRSLSYNDTDIVLVVFAVDNPTSLSNIKAKWVPEVEHHCEGTPFVLVGTKGDLRNDPKTIEKLKARNQELVSVEAAKEMSAAMNAVMYMECSALTGDGVKEIFAQALKVVLERHGHQETEPEKPKKCCTIL
jgi:small GTP-binding protein